MNCIDKDLPSFISLLIAVYLVVPICFPSLGKSVYAQDPVPVDCVRTKKERVDLPGGGYKEVYRNADGVICLEEEFAFGVKVKTKSVEMAYPSGQEARVTFSHIDINGTRNETIWYERNGEPRIRHTVRQPASSVADGPTIRTQERWNRRTQTWDRTRMSSRQTVDGKSIQIDESWPDAERRNTTGVRFTDTIDLEGTSPRIITEERLITATNQWEMARRITNRSMIPGMTEPFQLVEVWDPRTQTWQPGSRRVLLGGDNTGGGAIIAEEWSSSRQMWLPVPDIFDKPLWSDSNHGVESNRTSEMKTTTFITPEGEIVVNILVEAQIGERTSGTFYIRPNGSNAGEKKQNADRLGEYEIGVGNETIKTDSEKFVPFSWRVPTDSNGIIDLMLKNQKNERVAEASFSLVPNFIFQTNGYELQNLGQQGQPIRITGSFDGDFSTTSLKIGGRNVEIIAESAGRMFAFNSSATFGLTNIELSENGKTVSQGEFRNVGLTLSAAKLDLTRGEKTTMTVKVFGLEGITDPIPLIIENKSPGVINMAGGNTQNLTISPRQVRNGQYSVERKLTGIKRGKFSITATVIPEPN